MGRAGGNGAAVRASLRWVPAAAVVALTTVVAMASEVTTWGRPVAVQTGLDFSNNSWRAVRALLAGANIYGPTHATIPGVAPAWPVSPKVPATLLWEAPFAALPLRTAVLAFAAASIIAIWVAVFLVTQTRDHRRALLAASCGSFAVLVAGPFGLLLGQPSGFILLGLAVVMRTKRVWLGAAGLVPACSSFQDGVPLLVGLLVLGYGPMVWRGLLLIVACSLPPAGLEIANAGFGTACWSFVTGATVHLGRLSNRIDVGALLWRLGVTSETVQVMAGLAVAVAALVFLARLPAQLRRLSYPPTLCVMVLLTIEPIYHQAYAMLRVGGAVVPLIMVAARTRAMMPSFALALGSSALSSFAVCVLVAPVALLGMGLCAAVVAWRDTARIRQLVPAATLYGWGADPALELAA